MALLGIPTPIDLLNVISPPKGDSSAIIANVMSKGRSCAPVETIVHADRIEDLTARAPYIVSEARAPRLVEPAAEGSSAPTRAPVPVDPGADGPGPVGQALVVSNAAAETLLTELAGAGFSPDGPGGDAFVFLFSGSEALPSADISADAVPGDPWLDAGLEFPVTHAVEIAGPDEVDGSWFIPEDATPIGDWFGFVFDA